ncbi:MAG: peptidase M30 [Treponemataceae bacterium]
MKRLIPLTLAVITAFLSSCSFFLGTPSGGANADGPAVTRVPYSGNFTYDVDTGSTARDVFFVFSASADKTSYEQATVASLSVDGLRLPVPTAPKMPKEFGANATAAQKIADFNRTALSKSGAGLGIRALAFPGNVTSPRAYIAGSDTNDFYHPDTYIPNYDATCRKVVGPITVASDSTPRTLIIWVSNVEWGTRITQPMVDALADRFLKTGDDNDIYDWLTKILGPEWGTTSYTNLIPHTGDVHILLTDIEGDASPNGGVVGFFYAVNNFTPGTYSDTNQKIMFVIDSYMYANDTSNAGSWSADGFWPKEIFSTLAHEFQHMIHFYQKAVVAGAGDSADVWIDEMCAQMAEDLLADKMGVPGPRGVDYTIGSSGPANNTEGRIPIYNQYSYLPLAVTDSGSFGLLDYSTAYAFGAWVARNYGGAAFLKNVVCSAYMDKEAVEKAAAAGGATLADLDSLIQRWAVSVMGSDRADMPVGYVYNTGDWKTSTVNGSTYKLGSIDFHKYLPYDAYSGTYGQTPGPMYLTSSGPTSNLSASSNVYYAAARSFAGKKSFEVSLPVGVTMTVVVR